MVLSDFISTQNNNDSNPHEIIPSSFNIYQVLHKNIIIQKIIWCKHDPKLDPVELNSQRFMVWERI